MRSILLQDGRWWCPMCGPDGSWGWGMMSFMMLFWVVAIFAVVWLVFRVMRDGGAGGNRAGGDGAETILRERYARGEIDREAYERMLADLRHAG
jgi:putative membrane protein